MAPGLDGGSVPCPECGSPNTARDVHKEQRGSSMLWLAALVLGLSLGEGGPGPFLERPLWFNGLTLGLIALGLVGYWLRWGDGETPAPMYCGDCFHTWVEKAPGRGRATYRRRT
jgi:hypothetical protein